MISAEDLAFSARYQDAISDEHGHEKVFELGNVDADGLQYIAQQRALRVAMLLDGMNPRELSRTEKTEITLSEMAQHLMPSLTALAMDSIMIGVHAARRDEP
jgi:hypothetical protein